MVAGSNLNSVAVTVTFSADPPPPVPPPLAPPPHAASNTAMSAIAVKTTIKRRDIFLLLVRMM
jgi:hypothetical protein